MFFDARAAKLLKAGEHIVVDGCSGLRLVATASVRSWVYRYQSKVDGRMRQIKIGEWPAVPAAAAAAKWQALKALRDAGQDPAQEKRATRQVDLDDVYTVGNLLGDYISGHLMANREPKGARAVAVRLTNAIEPISKIPASSVTRRVAFDLISGLAETPVLARSVRNELGAAWDLALDAGRLGEDAPNWWRQILSGKLRSKGAVRDGVHKGTAKRVLSEREIAQLVNADFTLLAQVVQDVLTITLWTGARGGEAVQIHASQITQEAGGWWWTLPKARQKNKNRVAAMDLRVPLEGRALDVVKRRLAVTQNGYLFPSTSKEGYPTQAGIQSQVNFRQPHSVQRPDVYRQRLSVINWSPHDLRRTARTMLAGLGCPEDVAEAILGHVRPGVAGIYNLHKYDSERRLWLQRWSERLEVLID